MQMRKPCRGGYPEGTWFGEIKKKGEPMGMGDDPNVVDNAPAPWGYRIVRRLFLILLYPLALAIYLIEWWNYRRWWRNNPNNPNSQKG